MDACSVGLLRENKRPGKDAESNVRGIKRSVAAKANLGQMGRYLGSLIGRTPQDTQEAAPES